MKKCASCGLENAPTEDYCLGCGAELGASASATPSPDPTAAPVASVGPSLTAGVAAFTLTFGDQAIPLYEGQKFTIARTGSVANPNLAVPADDVSGTPLELVINGGKLEVGYGGTEPKSWAVLKNLAPGQQMTVEAGEAIMAGAGTVIFVS